MTQNQIILQRLQSGEWLSTVEAVRSLFILRLGARIWDLKKQGHQIEERRVKGKTYSEYRLAEEASHKVAEILTQYPPRVEKLTGMLSW